jgi:hypothetical protein
MNAISPARHFIIVIDPSQIEPHLAFILRANLTGRNAPFDLILRHFPAAVELKEITKRTKSYPRHVIMNAAAVARKLEFAKVHNLRAFTVAVYQAHGQITYYVREGVGCKSLNQMTQVRNPSAIRDFIRQTMLDYGHKSQRRTPKARQVLTPDPHLFKVRQRCRSAFTAHYASDIHLVVKGISEHLDRPVCLSDASQIRLLTWLAWSRRLDVPLSYVIAKAFEWSEAKRSTLFSRRTGMLPLSVATMTSQHCYAYLIESIAVSRGSPSAIGEAGSYY